MIASMEELIIPTLILILCQKRLFILHNCYPSEIIKDYIFYRYTDFDF
jgi:hypothetical protein